MQQNQPASPHPDKAGNQSPEFDPARYPEKVACKALPSLDGQTVAVEIEDVWGDTSTVEGIPMPAVVKLNMPRLGPAVPDQVRDVFERGIGLGLLSCRKEEMLDEAVDNLESPVKIHVPTTSGDIELIVRRSTLARPLKG